MAYSKLGFVDGEELHDYHLNHIEQGIYDNSVAISEAENHLPTIGENGNWWEWNGTEYVDTGKPSRGNNGEDGSPGRPGEPGAQGEPGHTPIKGTDYFTQEDIDEVINEAQGRFDNRYANALKGSAHGEYVRLDGISPLDHAVAVKVSGVDTPAQVTVKAQGANILDVHNAGVYHTNASNRFMSVEITETGLRMTAFRGSTGGPRCGFRLGTVKELAGKTITLSGKYSSSVSGGYLLGVIFGTNIEPTPAGRDPIYDNGGYIGADGTIESLAMKAGPVTYTVTGSEGWEYIGVLFYFSTGVQIVAGDVTEIRDIQVELGESATEYEPYKPPVEYTPDENGECVVDSIAPTTTLLTDTEGAIIDCEYNKDINKAFEELVNAIISMGGNI